MSVQIITGGCKGTDAAAMYWADRYHIPFRCILPSFHSMQYDLRDDPFAPWHIGMGVSTGIHLFVITGGDMGVCAGVLFLCKQLGVHCAFFLPHDDDRGGQNRLEVGFAPILGYPRSVIPGKHPVTDGVMLEGDELKHSRVVCMNEHHDETITTTCRALCPDYDQLSPSLRYLLRRDVDMVVQSDAVYLIGDLIRPSHSSNEQMGGPGWIQHVTILKHKPLYFFDLSTNTWLTFDYTRLQFRPHFGALPSLRNHHCLIAGTRRLMRKDPVFFDILPAFLLTARA